MKTKVWKRILPLFLSIVMLFSVFAAAIPAVSAKEIAAPSNGGADDESPYYRIVFEDGILHIQLNPQKVYDLLRDGSISKEDLLNFLPEDVLDTLAQGRDLSLDDLKALVSNYISPSDLSNLKEILPVEVLQEHFDLAMLEDLITVEELLSLVPIDELLNGVDDEKIAALINPATLKLLLNETAKDAVLTDEFIENLLDEGDVLDTILSNAETKEALVKLIDGAIVDQLLADDTIKSNLLALMDRSSTLDSILADETAKTALKNYFDSKKSTVSSFLTDSAVLELLKDMPSVHDSLVTDGVIERLISSNAIHKGNVRTIFSDAQLESLIDDSVLEKLLSTDHFVDNFLNDDELLNTIFTPELILELKTQGLLDSSYLFDRTQLRSMLLSSAEARALVSDEIHHHPEISLTHYWDHLDFLDLVNAIGIHSIQVFVDTHDDVYENILHSLGAAQIAEALGENVCASILQNNLAEILRAVGMPKLFTYFDRNEIVSALGGYYALLQKGYVDEEDIVTAVGGYPALMEYLPLEGIIEAVGYDRLLDFVDFNDIVTSAGGYATVFSWYSPAELQAILNAIGTDSLKTFLTDSGILQQLDFKKIASDLVALLRSKGPAYQAFLQEAVDRFLVFLNFEVASIYINDTQIYSPGHFDFEAIVASILGEIPDVNAFLAMQEGDALAEWILRATVRGEEYQFGISLEFIGDFSELQLLAAEHADDFVWKVSDELDIVSKTAIPAVGSEIYEKVLLSDRVPTELKKKLLTAPTEVSLGELPTFLTEISDEELQSIVDTISEKIDVIRAKTYAKLDATLGGKAEKLAVAKAKADQLLNAFTSVERIKALRDKVIGFVEGKIPAELADKTLTELYEGDQNFRFEGTISKEYYDKALALLQKLGLPKEAAVNILVYFGNSLALEGTFDTTIALKGIYQLTLKDSEEKTHVFYLPAGIDLSIIKEFFPSLDIAIPEGTLMPSEDTTLSDPDVWWQVDFYADGKLVKSVYYLKGVDALDPLEIPTVPEKLGYSAVWGSYTLGEQEITRVDAIYTKITYTTTIKDETIFPEDYEFDLEYSQADRSLELPIPEKFGYTFMTWYIDVDNSGTITEGDIKLERRVMFRMLRSAPTLETFLLPDGEVIPAGDDLALIAEFEVTYYDITFVDYNGNPIPNVSLSYSPLPEFLDKAALTAQFPSLSLAHYTLAWYVEDTAWDSYDLSLGGDLIVTSKKTPIPYTVTFQGKDGSTILSVNYDVENLPDFSSLPTIPDLSASGYANDGEWYVVVDGNLVKLSEYTVAGGNLVVKANYTAIEYTATFYDYQGNVVGTAKFTVDGWIDTPPALPEVPARPGYTAVWESYTLGTENLDIHPEYTPITYNVTFKYADGSTTTGTYTVEDYSLFSNLPAVPDRAGYKDGAWYVGDVRIDAFTPTTGDLVIQAKYTIIEYTATFYNKAGTVIDTVKFTVEGFLDESEIPAVPEIPGYKDGKWDYTTPLQPGDMDVRPEYTLIIYTVTIKATGHSDQTRTYTVEDLSAFYNLPIIEGYDTVTWYLITAEGESVFDIANVTYGDVVLEGRGTYIEYNVSFKVNGEEIGTDTYTVVDTTITAPSIPSTFPDKPGYTKDWYVVSVDGVALTPPVLLEDYLITAENLGALVIEARYTAIKYTATFKDKEGAVVGTLEFTVEGFLGTLPLVPEIPGYKDGKWVYSSPLPSNDIDVLPEYTLITYTVTFKYADGTTEEKTYTVEDLSLFSNLPLVPDRAGYQDGAWYVGDVRIDAFTPTTGDLVIEAKYTAIKYTATFYDKDGNILGTAKFTVEGWIDTTPSVSEREGYNGSWILPTQLPANDLDVRPDYEAIEYTATFKDENGNTVAEIIFTVEGLKGTTPEVPHKLGYDALWNIPGQLPAKDIEIFPQYNLIWYILSFRDKNDQAISSISYNITTDFATLALPEIADLSGQGYSNDGFWYIGDQKLLEYVFTEENLTHKIVRAKYTAIEYTATFKDKAGNTLGTAIFTVEGFLDESKIPAVPAPPAGYENDGRWNYSTLLPGDRDFYPIYSLIEYRAVFSVFGADTVYFFNVEDLFEIPSIPAPPEGYANDGVWYVVGIGSAELDEPITLDEYFATYSVHAHNIFIEAKYTRLEYTASFKDADGNDLGTASFTVEGFLDPASVPTLAAKPGYRIEYYLVTADAETLFDPYFIDSLPANDIEVKVIYVINIYTVVFQDKYGNVLDSFTYTVLDLENLDFKTMTFPEIPDLTSIGYANNGIWYVNGNTDLRDYVITLDNLGDVDVRPNYQAIEYTATFKDENGKILGTAIFTVEGFKDAKPTIPEKPGYIGAWVYPNGIECPPNDMVVTLKYTPIPYGAIFLKEDGSVLLSTTYDVENALNIPDVPAKAEHVGAWYVIRVNGVPLSTPIKLSEYDLRGENLGELEIKAVYELKTYTAYFRVNGVVIGSVTFTIETEELSGIPAIPAKRGYTAKWSTYELGREDLYIDAIYSLAQYTATFKNEDGKTVGTVNFTINDTTIKAPELPVKEKHTGAWYVVKVNSKTIDPVLLSEFELTDADLTVQAMYDAEEKEGLAWIWWIIIILILIILILAVLLVLKKKNLPPFKREETPPAIIAAAIPEEEEVEEEEQPEIPVVPIVTVESVDVETADELMTDATAIAVVETVEGDTSAGQKVIVNLHVINDNFAAGETVDLDALKSKKLVSSKAGRVKILADGTLDKPLTVIADAFSVQAIKMITLTGGHAVQKKSKR